MHLLIFADFFFFWRPYKTAFFNVMPVFACRYETQFLIVKTLIFFQLAMTLHLRTTVSCDVRSFNTFLLYAFSFQVIAVGA